MSQRRSRFHGQNSFRKRKKPGRIVYVDNNFFLKPEEFVNDERNTNESKNNPTNVTGSTDAVSVFQYFINLSFDRFVVQFAVDDVPYVPDPVII